MCTVLQLSDRRHLVLNRYILEHKLNLSRAHFFQEIAGDDLHIAGKRIKFRPIDLFCKGF